MDALASKPSDSGTPDRRKHSPTLLGPGSKERRSQPESLPLSDASSNFDPLHVPDGLSNGRQGRQRAGLDPMELDPAVLTAAGHPPMRTRAVVAAYKRIMGGDCFSVSVERVQRHKDIRAVCGECVDENAAEVCRCTTFWCPFWPHRTGKNPHNPQRGKNPFCSERTVPR